MRALENPALQDFVASFDANLLIAQVWIQRAGGGYELRHAEDRATDAPSLSLVAVPELRALAGATADSAFRPLKSAPTLRRGWRALAATDNELAIALDHLYPGALADWHAARSSNPPITSYREYTGRQSGMYRVTAKLTDAQVAEVIQATCAPAMCLKRRLWTIARLATDASADKSIVPCLEPCAIFMEQARQAFRDAQAAEKEADFPIANGPEME